ncbi:MAG: hypothetical protein IKF80_09040, partial [Erysipelotrichaceae bacterium]|nr:hypothetical protein [Erysipelotrichaceae bacterium]
NDDWLQKEREEEKKTSVWDFDGVRRPTTVKEEYRPESPSATKKDMADVRTILWFIFDIFLVVGLSLFNAFSDNGIYLPSLILFLMINPGIFIWVFLFKRFMPTWYLIAGALIAIIIEFLSLFSFLG